MPHYYTDNTRNNRDTRHPPPGGARHCEELVVSHRRTASLCGVGAGGEGGKGDEQTGGQGEGVGGGEGGGGGMVDVRRGWERRRGDNVYVDVAAISSSVAGSCMRHLQLRYEPSWAFKPMRGT